MTMQNKFEQLNRLAHAARRETSPAIDVRLAVRQRIRQLQSPEPSVLTAVFDIRPWIAASCAAAMTAAIVGVLAITSTAASASSNNADQSLANLTQIVDVTLQ